MAQDKFVFWGLVRDHITSVVQKGVRATLMTTDSVVVDTMNTSEEGMVYDQKNMWRFRIPSEKVLPSYIIRFEKKGYYTAYLDFEFKKKGSQDLYRMPDVKIKRMPVRNLGEAVVRASRIKFYTKDDTLVYNADAFQLAEGSMLDALVRQLPGVELKDDGRIFVNGRFVESLLLNGEEFFTKDGSLMLDNLPAYMVKHVQVYEKTDWKTTDKPYVMDVKLKRQYSIGWIANAEAGGGSDGRYMGRLFGLRFTPNSRLTFFGNLNNVNENRKPGQSGEWTPANMPSGENTLRQGGIDYLIKEKEGRYKLQGNATLTSNDGRNYTRTSTENYLQSGTAYRYAMNDRRNRSLALQTSHTFGWERVGSYYYSFSPSFNYSKWDNDASTLSAEVNRMFNWTSSAQALDSLFSPNAGAALLRALVNRSQSTSVSKGHSLRGGLGGWGTFSIPGTNKRLELGGNVNYRDYLRDEFSQDLYEYPQETAQPEDFRHNYGRYRLKEWTYSVNARLYQYFLDRGQLRVDPFVNMQHYFTQLSDGLYRLDELPGWSQTSSLEQLPSERTYLQTVVDNTNSYVNHRRDLSGNVGVEINYDASVFYFKATLPLLLRRERQEYARAQIDTLFYRNTLAFNPTASIYLSFINREEKRYGMLSFDYKGNSIQPSMITLLDTRSDSNPLQVTLGNPDLKSSYRHHAEVSYRFRNEKTSRFMNAQFGYDVTHNNVAYGFTYDPATGVYTYRPENINGNYNLNAALGVTAPLDKGKRLTLSNNLGWNYYHNVDLMGTDGTAARRSTRSTVRTQLVSEQLRLDLDLGKYKLGAKGNVTWQGATSGRTDFEEISAWNYQYGLTAQLTLPWNVQLNTDLTVYSRRGYAMSGMNTNDVVWNARVAKSFLQGNLTFMVDGFDILHQLSGTSFVVNGQGRTETFRNVLPRYVMAHLIYRLNIKPKKRPGDA